MDRQETPIQFWLYIWFQQFLLEQVSINTVVDTFFGTKIGPNIKDHTHKEMKAKNFPFLYEDGLRAIVGAK
jgi:hypothetical protein